MRKLPLALTSTLIVLACGDDGPTQDPSADSGSTSDAETTTTGPDLTSTTIEPTTTDASSTGLDSTGPSTLCGNGIVDEGEDCDDENMVEDDACYSNCTIPFEVLWTATYDGGDADFGNHALFDAEGNLYVLGATEVAGQALDLWLRQYAPDGSEGWTWTYDGALHGDDVGRSLAWLDGDLVIAGSEVTDTGDDVLVIRLAVSDQSTVWTQRYDGPGSGPASVDEADFATDVAVDAAGEVLVAGTHRVDGQEYDVWLRKYDADGNELWTHTYDDATVHLSDGGQAVLADASGDVYLVGNTEVAPGEDEGWVRRLDTDGNELWTQTIPFVFLTSATLDAAGNLVLAGLDYDNPDNGNMWAAKYDPDFAPLGSTIFDGPSGVFDEALGVAVDAGGDVYLTGFVTVVGDQSNVWVGRYMPDLGLRWWSDSYANTDAHLADDGREVVVSDDGSRVAVVGLESVIGEDTNIWVRMYQNNPTP